MSKNKKKREKKVAARAKDMRRRNKKQFHLTPGMLIP